MVFWEFLFVIPFGFASNIVLLDEMAIEKSGLTIMMSRGVGNQRNRKETIELIKRSKGKFISDLFLFNINDNTTRITFLFNNGINIFDNIYFIFYISKL